MNCLYITLFFNIVAGIVQTFIKSWSQFLHPRVIEVCCQPFELRYDFFLHLIIVVELSEVWWKTPCFISTHNVVQKLISFLCVELRNFSAEPIRFVRMTERTSHLAGLWIGAVISNTSQTKPVLPLSNEHGSQVKDQGRRHCCHNKHKKVHIGLHVMYLYFPDTPRIYRSSRGLDDLRIGVWFKTVLQSAKTVYGAYLLPGAISPGVGGGRIIADQYLVPKLRIYGAVPPRREISSCQVY